MAVCCHLMPGRFSDFFYDQWLPQTSSQWKKSSFIFLPVYSLLSSTLFFLLVGLILHRALALTYLFLVSVLPGLFHIILHPLSLTRNLHQFVSFQLQTILPTFLLTLLEAQSIFHWTGVQCSARAMQVEYPSQGAYRVKCSHRPCWTVGWDSALVMRWLSHG